MIGETDTGLKQIFASSIKEALKDAKMCQNVLAEKIGMSPQHMSLICLGKHLPRHKTLLDISIALNVTLDYLYGISED